MTPLKLSGVGRDFTLFTQKTKIIGMGLVFFKLNSAPLVGWEINVVVDTEFCPISWLGNQCSVVASSIKKEEKRNIIARPTWKG